MYIYLYMYMYLFMYTYMFVYIYICICMYMYMYVYVYDRCMVYRHALGLVMLPSDHSFWDYDDMFLYTCGIHTYIYYGSCIR